MSLLWWVIPNELAGMPMPFVHPQRRMNQGGKLSAFDDELPLLADEGIKAVVSLLNLPGDLLIYTSAGFDFLCLPIPDGGAPSLEQAYTFTRFVDACREQEKAVAVHCEAGIGRTGTMLAAYLILKGTKPEHAISRVRAAEPAAIETHVQANFLRGLVL